MKGKIRKITLAALSLTMAATISASSVIAFASDPSRKIAADSMSVQQVKTEELTGKVDMSELARSNFTDKVEDTGEQATAKSINSTETLIVSLDTPSITDRTGGDADISGYLNTTEGRRAADEIAKSQNDFLAALSGTGVSYKLVARYSKVLNGVAIEVNTAHASKIQRLSGVSMTGLSRTYAALDAQNVQTNPSNVYGTGIYDSSEYDYDGSGVTVAILDTGLDYTHEAFQTMPSSVNPNFTREKIAQAVEKTGNEALSSKNLTAQRGGNLTVDDVYINAKVPFAYDYADKDADVYPSYSQHGTHVAGIVAGQADTYIDKDGHVVGQKDDGKNDFLGVAPNAQLVICKVFTDDLESKDLGGATSEDIIAALDDCVTLGVDIINMSLGTACGFSMTSNIPNDSEGEQLNRVYNSIKNQGISLITAAGNEYSSGYGSDYGTNLISNPDSGTVGSPSTFAGAISVASVNGQTAPYMVSNPTENGGAAIYFNEANDANSVPYDFAEELMDAGVKQGKFKYYVIPGTGQAGDYSSFRSQLTPVSEGGTKADGEKVLVVVRRGNIDFKTKVETACRMGADGIIIYNNVPGTIRMTLGDIAEEDRIPAVSVDMSAGTSLTYDPRNPSRLRREGEIEINTSYQAGPFMNDYSSWGATPDLKLKPDITSHGGEITSTVAGGYEEMSGTSMATPNLAGFMALVKDYLREKNGAMNASELTRLTNQIVMSSATLLFDEDKLPYSPRKQGSGLATLANVFSTKAYLWTDGEKAAEDNRPKVELYEDEEKKGEYEFSFKLTNTDSQPLTFTIIPRFMTETIAAGGIAVAEAAYMLDDNPAQLTVAGQPSDGNVTVEGNGTVEIGVKLTLSSAEKEYLNRFPNGMYVEGFISLDSKTDGQCDLNLPFMGFYGDWESAPMLDYDAYEIAEIEKDTSLKDDEKPSECVFATQLYSTYYNEKYAVPMGGYAYVQDEDADQIYVEEDHCAVSRFNEYNGPTATDSYMTSTGIRSLYAGLLRNAELVTYDLYNADTGELVTQGEKYRVGKAYAGGGSSRPALVDLKLSTEDLGLVNNGKYRIEFKFYMYAKDKNDPEKQNTENTFASNFYVDYDAPMLEGAKIRFYNYTQDNRVKQRIYLDLDIYDNHYPQSVLLGYDPERKSSGQAEEIKMATEYVTPVYNAKRNGTTSVSIEITDIYDEWKDNLYVQIDDYALNHRVYGITSTDAKKLNQDGAISFADDRITQDEKGNYNLDLSLNEAYRINFDCGNSNPANYEWNSTRNDIVKIKDGEIFAAKTGKSIITIRGGRGTRALTLNVNVSGDNPKPLSLYSLSFTPIEDNHESLHVAAGTVSVNAGRTFDIKVVPDPWYFPLEDYDFNWSCSSDKASVVADATDHTKATVTTGNTRGRSILTAAMVDKATGNATSYSATVILSVQDPYVISSMTLSRYYGSEPNVVLPDDKNIMTIGEEAFKDNTTMESIVIPKTVTDINERAFLNCTALKNVYFIKETDDGAQPEDDLAALNIIYATAFQGCTSLERLDLTNVKVITVGARAFADCENLKKIVHMEKIGIADEYAFAGCSKLESIDISGLHTSAPNVFMDCIALNSVTTDKFTMISEGMFYGCTNLASIEINNARVSGNRASYATYYGMDADGNQTFEKAVYGGGAFEKCTKLTTVTFGGTSAAAGTVRIDPYAFNGCTNLSTVNFNNNQVSYIGDYAFAGCTNLSTFTMPAGNPVLGNNVFGSNTTITWGGNYETDSQAVYSGKTLVKAPSTISATFTPKSGTKEIGPYAFSGTTFSDGASINLTDITNLGEGAFYGVKGLATVTLPDTLTEISDYAFAKSSLTSITIPANIERIGANAFEGAENLATISFDGSSQLKEIGSYAFSDTAITQIALPDGAATMGLRVFGNCTHLTTVTLPSVTSLGGYTFVGCTALQTVTFGNSATASGDYTFFPGYDLKGMLTNDLTSVTLSDAMTAIGDSTFLGCSDLVSIDLKNVKSVGTSAFHECTSLATVTGLDKLTDIGNYAFLNTAITAINIPAAVTIGNNAFSKDRVGSVLSTSLTLGAAEKIGTYAFAGNNLTSVFLPATLKDIGAGVFLNNANLATITVNEGNQTLFADSNVLYRKIVNFSTGETTYELCCYPAGKRTATYKVLDETSSIQAFAMAYLPAAALRTVDLPYSLKTIGDGAFYKSNITRYNFYSIAAPTLLTEYLDLSTVVSNPDFEQFRSLYYRNFNNDFILYSPVLVSPQSSAVTIGYPENGTGYDNYVFSRYFGTKVSLGVCCTDDTRNLIKAIDGFMSIDDIKNWNSAEVNSANKAAVMEFSERVKDAHRLLNNILNDEKQLAFLNEGQNREQKLYDIEAALKPVKSRFGIPVSIQLLSVDESSTHKTEYKVGEKFVLDGLVIAVTYDDYSIELVSDTSLMSIASGYDGALTTDFTYVRVNYGGDSVYVPITIVEGTVDEGDNNPSSDGKQGNMLGLWIGLGVGIPVALIAAAVVAILIIRSKKNKVNSASDDSEVNVENTVSEDSEVNADNTASEDSDTNAEDTTSDDGNADAENEESQKGNDTVEKD